MSYTHDDVQGMRIAGDASRALNAVGAAAARVARAQDGSDLDDAMALACSMMAAWRGYVSARGGVTNADFISAGQQLVLQMLTAIGDDARPVLIDALLEPMRHPSAIDAMRAAWLRDRPAGGSA